jgi:hypothetical protein
MRRRRRRRRRRKTNILRRLSQPMLSTIHRQIP